MGKGRGRAVSEKLLVTVRLRDRDGENCNEEDYARDNETTQRDEVEAGKIAVRGACMRKCS